MKLIRQHPDSGLCVACCLAMVVNKDVNYVLDRVRLRVYPECPRPCVPMREAIRFLYEHGMHYGSPWGFKDAFNVQPGVNSIIATSVELTQPIHALVTVSSTRIDGAMHMVVWNHEEELVYDPQEETPQPLSKYKLVEWANLVDLREL